MLLRHFVVMAFFGALGGGGCDQTISGAGDGGIGDAHDMGLLVLPDPASLQVLLRAVRVA